MPIKNFITGDVPYLERYNPYQVPLGTIEAGTISDMISYDVKPHFSPTMIEYVLGSTDLYVESLNIKNITLNADVEVTVRYFKNIFYVDYTDNLVSKDIGVEGRELKKVLFPGENIKFTIVLNNSLMDAGIYNEADTSITLVARNVENGKIVTKIPTLPVYVQRYLPQKVRIE